MRKRADFLRDTILPQAVAQGFDEIIVVGRCDEKALEGFDVTYLHLPPLKRDRSEALRQREAATRWSSADVFVYSCDDHVLCDGFLKTLRSLDNGHLSDNEHWDVLTPKRVNASTGEEQNNGRPDGPWPNGDGYSPFHTNVLRRWVWAKVPYTSMDVIASDIPMTNAWRRVGAKVKWTEELHCRDLEAKEGEL